MAIDEAVWRGRQAGASPPTLRFFAWAPPTVSLGYGQPLDGHVDTVACRRLGVGLVRRPTGGSAIYHDGPERELTYSVAAAADDIGGGARDLLHSYPWIGRAPPGSSRRSTPRRSGSPALCEPRVPGPPAGRRRRGRPPWRPRAARQARAAAGPGQVEPARRPGPPGRDDTRRGGA